MAAAMCAASCQSAGRTAAPIEAGTCWFDGYEFFVCSTDSLNAPDSLFRFEGGTLHEGGSAFALRLIGGDTFAVEPIAGADWVSMGEAGGMAVLDSAGGKPCLLFLHSHDGGADTLFQFDPGNEEPIRAYAKLLYQHHLDGLSGTYLDPKSKTTYRFADSLLIRTKADGRADTLSFTINYEWEMPSHTLLLSDNTAIWYEKTKEGLDLFRTKHWNDGEGWYSREAKIAALVRQ